MRCSIGTHAWAVAHPRSERSRCLVLLSGVWSQERYDDVEKRLTPFLKQCGYNVKRDVQFLPISGLKGSNIKSVRRARIKLTSSSAETYLSLLPVPSFLIFLL
jgi:hypothetical protein